MYYCFFFKDTATTEIYTLSLHDALPISGQVHVVLDRLGGLLVPEEPHKSDRGFRQQGEGAVEHPEAGAQDRDEAHGPRSEEHTSELQSRQYLVCRLLLEKKKKI